ncbi:spore coat polysaccharide biosynthesis protein SpsF [Halanaerobium saccharolyticum]|uniref:Spore coat polysaccharide biosynthesis protein SpsF n=1 Tax=Halanaerobium saccharolyticum TaxID=43595 RepID=A0A4R7Z4K4_9FIRM|nr:glycosyltransferase family protein [Halanaerobium saccharolyticum]RAK12633.1 spore coat polysaccharide biosynthesis protein SpsF [Halanaerobium saccharolyticum]TDW05455.1 spore coat polysaccharide biosynthesis protein SpsF [Halanaerobium saccharolyticum]TDX62970.1 spore coat polysaccharide biosynthesis protein SpsF [Halanaerobium saccharolyticum]
MKSKKTAAIIQARMGSNRLPGKVMKDLKGKPVLWHVIERVKQAENIDQITIATTTHKRDKIIYDKAIKWGVVAYQGSEEDVLARYYEAVNKYEVDTVVRITSDCPLIDPYVIDEIVEYYNKNDYTLVTNAGSDLNNRTYPRGLDTEVFSFEVLEEAYNKAEEKYQREHVTPYIYENYDDIYYYKKNKDLSNYRLTLDTKEDFELIKALYDKLYQGNHDFYLNEIVEVLNKNKELLKINQKIKQKDLK